MTLFIIQSESGEFLDKSLEWVKNSVSASVFQTPYRDIALNQLIELNAKDISLRAKVIRCETNERGQPDLTSVAA